MILDKQSVRVGFMVALTVISSYFLGGSQD